MSYESSDPCVCCGLNQSKMVTYHHILRRKSWPEHAEKAWNKISVCLWHHNEFHGTTTKVMADKYPGVLNFLIIHKWVFELGKYRNYSDLPSDKKPE